MLSGTQTKYDLQRSSGSIGENINYIYYFTYFHKFEVHPFWDKFEREIKEIKPCLEGLTGSITALQETHKTIKEAVISTYSNPNNLFETIETIRCDINVIDCNLKCYISDKLEQIKVELQCKKKEFEQQLKCTSEKSLSDIIFVKRMVSLIIKVKITLKIDAKIIMNENRTKSIYYYEITESSEKCEEIKEIKKIEKIEKKLQSFIRRIKVFKEYATNSIPSPDDLTCDNFNKYFDKKMKEIEKYINKLECVMTYIKERELIIKKNIQNTTVTEGSEGNWKKYLLEQRTGGHEKNYIQFDLSYKKEITKIENLISVKDSINDLLKDVCSEISKLDEQVNCFNEELSNFKKELERLKYIKFLNDLLQKDKGRRQLDLIKAYSLNLKYGLEQTQHIEIGLKRFKSISDYYYCINLIRNTVDCFLDTLGSERYNKIKDADSSKGHLENVMSALQCVKDNLCNLESIRNIIPKLIEIAPNIAQLVGLLQKVESVMSTLQKEIKHLESNLETTSQKLEIMTRFRDTVDNAIRTIGVYIHAINEIKEIKEAGEEITKQYNEYKEKFSEFKKALNILESFLDYLIRDFLRCSLCTTICNLKRELRDTKWQCPDTECSSCQTTTLMTDKVFLLQSSLQRYVFSLLGHFSTLDTKVFISKLYRCILRVDQIVGIVQVVYCCKCVKGFGGTDNTDKTGNSNNPKTCMMKYGDFFNSNKETQDDPGRLDTSLDTDNNLNHLCLCLVISHKLYPCLLKTVTLLVQLELRVSGNIAKKYGTHSKYDSYNLDSWCNSHYNLSVSTILLLSTWVMIKLASFIEHRYKIEHDKVKCCTKEKEPNCKCECKKNGDSSDSSTPKCCPCCGCENNKGTASSSEPTVTPDTTPTPCCCTKSEGKKGCRQADSSNKECKTCCCRCCCQCVCENKRGCECTCNHEQHCFCKKYGECPEDPYYRWFIYVILYICHLVDNAFSLGHLEIQHAMQLLSNLITKLDAVCWQRHERCVTVAVKGSVKVGGSGEGGQAVSEATTALPSPTCPLPVQPASSATSSPQPSHPKVKCCIVCVNVKVVCVSTHVLCITHVLVGKCKTDKPDGKKEECKLVNIECICECKEAAKCLEKLQKLDVNNNLKFEVFKGLKEKLTKLPELTNLKNLNGDKANWTLKCDCKSDKCKCLCKDSTTNTPEVCKNLKLELTKLDELKCGCESVVKCCCCCPCDECGTGKSRKCNEKGCGHTNGGGNGHNGGTQTGGTANKVDNNCPCLQGKKEDEKKCCCENTGAGKEAKRTCNCTKDKPAKTPEKPQEKCECCCFSCCALEKDEEKQEEEKPKEPQQANGKKCPCKKKKKKDKPKKHCKDDDNLKDKRCCCKCCPKENGGDKAKGETGEKAKCVCGKPATAATPTAAAAATTTNPNDKECCCCCKCKTNCKNGGGTTGSGNVCKCNNGMVQSGQQKPCKCYCCFECKHYNSALKSICKKLAYELNSSILVLSKLASNMSIECCQIYP